MSAGQHAIIDSDGWHIISCWLVREDADAAAAEEEEGSRDSVGRMCMPMCKPSVTGRIVPCTVGHVHAKVVNKLTSHPQSAFPSK